MELKQKILEALNESGMKIVNFEFEQTATGKIGGILTSDDFIGMDEIERQEFVWGKLKLKLTEDECHHIISLITVTSKEERMFRQEV
jgi:acid stress-induced BolA-like protein IbaG/YrbA